MRIAVTFFLAALAGCSMFSPRATTPMPTGALKVSGQGSTKKESYDVAYEKAEDFCYRWRAAPSVQDQTVSWQGQVEEDTNTAVEVGRTVAAAAGHWVPGIGLDGYETELTYRCY